MTAIYFYGLPFIDVKEAMFQCTPGVQYILGIS